MTFSELRLIEPIVRAVAKEGYTTPTPIQTKAIPEAINGRDVLGCAQTGTGKTGAFALPVLHQLAGQPNKQPKLAKGRRPRAIVLAPTRELASQIFDSFKTYGRNLPLRYGVIFGGVNQYHQVKTIRAGIDVLIATPGRLLDLMNQGHIDLSAIEILVLDEADRMLDMGFIHDIRKVVKQLPEQRQTMLFSATMPREIQHLADSLLTDPIFVKAAAVAATADAIDQSVYMVSKQNKPELLERLLVKQNGQRTLVFSRTKHGADKLVKRLRMSGIKSDAIHSNKTQNARTRSLNDFKTGRTTVLIATDIASRGIDVNDITLVINYDLPDTPETYVHRIGRTARGGASGTAVAFCDQEQIKELRAIERLIKLDIDVNTDVPELLYDVTTLPKPRTERHSSPNGKPKTHRRQRSRSRSAGNGSSNAEQYKPAGRRNKRKRSGKKRPHKQSSAPSAN